MPHTAHPLDPPLIRLFVLLIDSTLIRLLVGIRLFSLASSRERRSEGLAYATKVVKEAMSSKTYLLDHQVTWRPRYVNSNNEAETM
jgi:hypothetical protein